MKLTKLKGRPAFLSRYFERFPWKKAAEYFQSVSKKMDEGADIMVSQRSRIKVIKHESATMKPEQEELMPYVPLAVGSSHRNATAMRKERHVGVRHGKAPSGWRIFKTKRVPRVGQQTGVIMPPDHLVYNLVWSRDQKHFEENKPGGQNGP